MHNQGAYDCWDGMNGTVRTRRGHLGRCRRGDVGWYASGSGDGRLTMKMADRRR